MQVLPDDLIAEFESQFDPDETIVDLCEWVHAHQVQTAASNNPWTMRNHYILVITQKNLYLFGITRSTKGFGKKKIEVLSSVGHWRSFPLSDLPPFEFIGMKVNGQVAYYKFSIYGGTDGSLMEFTGYLNAESTIEFAESLTSAANRYAAAAVNIDFTEQLAALGELHKEGILTSEEFTRAKELFIGRSPDAQRQAEQTLRSLKQLKDSGVLTEAEYATKKWDVLAS